MKFEASDLLERVIENADILVGSPMEKEIHAQKDHEYPEIRGK